MGQQTTTNVNKSILKQMEYFNIKDGNVADMNIGGQLGAGYQPDALDAATPLVMMPTTIVIMSTPTMYDANPAIGKMMKSLFESHAKTVTGIDFGYTEDVASTIIGNDGQEMEVPISTKRTAVSPNFGMQEVSGNLVWNMTKQWLWDMHHPDTNGAYSSVNANAGDGTTGRPFTMSAYSMSMMAIQHDPAWKVIDAAFYANMFPKATGEFGFERTVGTSKPMERTIDMSGIVYHNDYTKVLGKQISDTLQLQKLNYNKIKTNINSVESSISEAGLKLNATKVAGYQG